MHCGIEFLDVIIECRYKVSLFVPNTLFFVYGGHPPKTKACCVKAIDSFSYTNVSSRDISPGNRFCSIQDKVKDYIASRAKA